MGCPGPAPQDACDAERPCPDGFVCDAGSCVEAPDPCPGGCFIDEVCLAAGALAPDLACGLCDPARDPLGWSPAEAGTLCRHSSPLPCEQSRCDGADLTCADPASYVGDPSWTSVLEVTGEATYCWSFESLGAQSLTEALDRKARLHFRPGSYPLPPPGEAELRLPFCIETATGDAPAHAGIGTVLADAPDWQYWWLYRQPMTLGGDWELRAGGDVLRLDGSHSSGATFHLCRGACDGTPTDFRAFVSCTFEAARRWRHTVSFEGGQVTFELRIDRTSYLDTPPGIFFRAEGVLGGEPFVQTDYWKLAYSPAHGHYLRSFGVLFDQALGGACGLRVEGFDPTPGVTSLPTAATTGCALEPLETLTVTAAETTYEDP